MAASRMAGTSLDHYHLIGTEPTYDAASNTHTGLAGPPIAKQRQIAFCLGLAGVARPGV